MKIVRATERSKLDIPLFELLSGHGELKLRPDLFGKGLIEIRQTKDVLRLQVNGVVGRIPLTHSLVLDVQPKFSVSNLNRIIYASGSILDNPFSMKRTYAGFRSKDYLPIPLIRTFSSSLTRLAANGLMREYRQETWSGQPKPRINFIRSYQKYWSKLQPTKAIVEHFVFDQDNLVNQCLKLAAIKGLSIARSSEQLRESIPELAASLKQLQRVQTKAPSALLASISSKKPEPPSYRLDYHRALEQAIEIIRHVDVSLSGTGGKISLGSFLISLDDVFERYIRNVIADLPDAGNGRIATVDGNKRRHQKKLLLDNKKYDVKPDLIVKDSRGPQIIGDVKYKIKPIEEDRYQIIAHSMSYQVSKAVLIYPKPDQQPHSGCQRLGKIGPNGACIELFEYYFDLAGDLATEEENLRKTISKLTGGKF